MSISQGEERSDRMIGGFAALVIGLSLVSALLVIAGDCAAVFGLLVLALAATAFVFGIVLPALGRVIRGTPSTRRLRRSSIALLSMGLPVVLFYVEHYSHIAGCVG